MSSVPASAYLTLAIILFCIGLFGAFNKAEYSNRISLYRINAKCCQFKLSGV